LLDYIVNGISIADKHGFRRRGGHKDNLGNYRRIARCFRRPPRRSRGSLLIDGIDLRRGEGSDGHEPHPVSFLELFEIGANRRQRFTEKRHRFEI
jgi:hypothetical protein